MVEVKTWRKDKKKLKKKKNSKEDVGDNRYNMVRILCEVSSHERQHTVGGVVHCWR